VFKKDVIPYNPEGYWVYLPKSKGKQFDLLKDSVYNPLPKQKEYAPVSIQSTVPDSITTNITTPDSKEHVASTKIKRAKVFYTVKKGDNIAAIADWFDVTEKDVKEWNKVKGNNIAKGKKLQLFVDKSKTGYYKRINTMSAAQKKKLRKKD
jgi:LysM repeat protein